MPERLSLSQGWLIENMRSAVESFKQLHVGPEQTVSEQELNLYIELATEGLERNPKNVVGS